MTERTIFMTAVEIADPADRALYLKKACGDNTELRRQVSTLLAAHERDGSFLEMPAVEQVVGVPNADSSSDDTLALSRRAAAASEFLAFLTPTSKTDSLGRLGHYEVLDVVGRGGMGIVVRAFDEKLRRVVAIKALAPHLATNGTARQRFVREARATAAVSQDNVIAIHAVEDAGPVPYLVMHFVSGQTLQDKIDRQGPPPVKEVLRIGLQIAEGLAAAHKQGLIHRDVKPANILLENGVERVRITDFGLARAVDDASLTQSGMIAGTPQYMSPEQAEGRPVDQRSDLFSLGSVLYALGTGHAPFRADSTIAVLKRVCDHTPQPMREANAEIPDWLDAIVARLLAKDPARRFQTATEVAELLGKHLAHLQQTSLVPMAIPVASLVVPPLRRRRWVAAAGVALIATAGLAAYLISGPRHPVALVPAATTPENDKPADPKPSLTPEELAKRPSPLDGRKREDIPSGLLALAGDGDPNRAPSELVAMLGEDRFQTSGDKIRTLECSPDGKLLAVSSGPRVFLFAVKTARLVRTIEVHSAAAYRVAFNSTSTRLAAIGSGLTDPPVELWDLGSGKLLQSLQGHKKGALSVVFGPRDETIITGGMDGTVRVWTAADGKVKHVLPHGDHVHGLAVSPDGNLLVTACNDRTVRIWDLSTGILNRRLVGHTGQVPTVTFSPDGKWLASAGKELKLWDAATFAAVRTMPTDSSWVRFTPDSTTLLCGRGFFGEDEQHAVSRWNVNTGKKLAELPLLAQGSWAVFALTPDGKTLFSTRTDPPGTGVRAYSAETGKELWPRQAHQGAVLAVAVHPNGRLLASGGEDHTIRLWDLATRTQVHVFQGHAAEVTSLAFSGDGKLLASGSPDAVVLLWDVAKREMVRPLIGNVKKYSTLAFSPDGKTVAAGTEDGRVRSWDVATGNTKDSVRWHSGAVRTLAFSPDGKRLATSGADRKVQVVEVPGGQLLHAFTIGEGDQQLAFSSDGTCLAATCATPSTVYLWDLEGRKELVLSGDTRAMAGLAMQPVGRLLATGSADGTVRFWDRLTGSKRVLTFGSAGQGVRQVAFTPEGRYLAAAGDNGTIALLRVPALPGSLSGSPAKVPDSVQLANRTSPADALDPKAIPSELLPENAPAELVAVLGDRRLQHQGSVRTLRFIDNDRSLISLSKDRTVRFWDAASGQQQRLVKINTQEFLGSAISPDGTRLALGYDASGTVVLWDLANGNAVRTLHNAADRGVLFPGIAFSSDGKKMATGGRWYWCKVWDTDAGKELRRLEDLGCNTFAFAFSPDDKTLISTNEDGEVFLWDVETGQKRQKLAAHPKAVMGVAYSADGRTFVTAACDSTAKLWDASKGKELLRFTGHKSAVVCVTMTADGRMLATGSADNTVKLWEVATGKERATLTGHTGEIRAVLFTADGKTLASASDDGTVKLWDTTTGKERFPRQGHVGGVASVAVGPDGKTLASAGEDRTIQLWDLPTGKIVHTLTGHTSAVRALAFSPDGKWLASQGQDGKLLLWDRAAGKELLIAADTQADSGSLHFSPDGRLLAFASANGSLVLWDVAAGKVHGRFSGHPGKSVRLAFGPDGKLLASASADGVRLWDVASGWQLNEFAGPVKGYAGIAFSPDGRFLALATNEETIELRDVLTGAERSRFAAEVKGVSNLIFRADGRLLAYSGADGGVRLREIISGTRAEKASALFGNVRVNGIALTPEGRYLATANADGTVFVLRLAKRGEAFRTPVPPKN